MEPQTTPTAYKRVVSYVPEPVVDRSDLIRMKQAADLRGSSIDDINSLLNQGKLTEYVFDPIGREPRLVSRTELLSLPPYVRKRRELKEGEVRLNQVSRNRREQIKREREAGQAGRKRPKV